MKRLLLASGIQLPPAEAAEFEQTSAQVDVSLGEDGARAERLRGAALTAETAIAYALRGTASITPAARRQNVGRPDNGAHEFCAGGTIQACLSWHGN